VRPGAAGDWDTLGATVRTRRADVPAAMWASQRQHDDGRQHHGEQGSEDNDGEGRADRRLPGVGRESDAVVGASVS
jgi:hypothetical protein